jgi:hypothetical protein
LIGKEEFIANKETILLEISIRIESIMLMDIFVFIYNKIQLNLNFIFLNWIKLLIVGIKGVTNIHWIYQK